jgi:hypothetical protein
MCGTEGSWYLLPTLPPLLVPCERRVGRAKGKEVLIRSRTLEQCGRLENGSSKLRPKDLEKYGVCYKKRRRRKVGKEWSIVKSRMTSLLAKGWGGGESRPVILGLSFFGKLVEIDDSTFFSSREGALLLFFWPSPPARPGNRTQPIHFCKQAGSTLLFEAGWPRPSFLLLFLRFGSTNAPPQSPTHIQKALLQFKPL